MKHTSKQLAVLLAALLLMSPLGCSEKEEAPQEDQADAMPATAETPVDLEDVISSWQAGNTEQATAQFTRVDWEHPDVLANVPSLNLSQQHPAHHRNLCPMPCGVEVRVQSNPIPFYDPQI